MYILSQEGEDDQDEEDNAEEGTCHDAHHKLFTSGYLQMPFSIVREGQLAHWTADVATPSNIICTGIEQSLTQRYQQIKDYILMLKSNKGTEIEFGWSDVTTECLRNLNIFTHYNFRDLMAPLFVYERRPCNYNFSWNTHRVSTEQYVGSNFWLTSFLCRSSTAGVWHRNGPTRAEVGWLS